MAALCLLPDMSHWDGVKMGPELETEGNISPDIDSPFDISYWNGVKMGPELETDTPPDIDSPLHSYNNGLQDDIMADNKNVEENEEYDIDVDTPIEDIHDLVKNHNFPKILIDTRKRCTSWRLGLQFNNIIVRVFPNNLNNQLSLYTDYQKHIKSVGLPNVCEVYGFVCDLDYTYIYMQYTENIIEIFDIHDLVIKGLQKTIIGKGTYGSVYRLCSPFNHIAVKKMSNFINNQNIRQRIINEYQIHKKCMGHPNVCKVYGYFCVGDYSYIYMEYIEGCELLTYIKKTPHYFTPKYINNIFTQIMAGIKYIHGQNIIHNDLKLENIMIDTNNNIYIIDFGMSINGEYGYRDCGSYHYASPEKFKINTKYNNVRYTNKTDLWSCGVILFILITKRFPYAIPEDKFGRFDNNAYHDLLITSNPGDIITSPKYKIFIPTFMLLTKEDPTERFYLPPSILLKQKEHQTPVPT